MAKLGAYYGLCPLIDQKSLLGISEDSESGVVIVTLGKNIAIKYKLSDQKQLHSWRTKEKFTSPIIYDEQQSKYVAVFNQSYIGIWDGNAEYLDKLKKYKFSEQIHTILSCKSKGFIVFKNGAIQMLQESLDNRKDLTIENVIEAHERITDVLYTSHNDDIYIGLIVDSKQLVWTKFAHSGGDSNISKLNFKRKGQLLSGQVFHTDRNCVHFLTLWSDGRVFSTILSNSMDHGNLFAVVEALSSKQAVSIVSLDENYLAMYGNNCNEEGALLIIYNVQFKVVQSRQPFKLFTDGAKLWNLGTNLLFPVGQHLAVLPYHLDAEQLAALVGSHKTIEADPDADLIIVEKMTVAQWGAQPTKCTEIPELLKPKIEDFIEQGFSESVIFEELLPSLLEKKELDVIVELLKYFCDIPERSLARTLKFLLNCNKSHKKISKNPVKIQRLKRTKFVDWILIKDFNEALLLPHLRNELNLNEVLLLLNYICFLLSDDGHDLPGLTIIETKEKLYEWGCILLDSNYQKFLLTRDEKIMKIITLFTTLVQEELNCLNDLRQIVPILAEIENGNNIFKPTQLRNLNYSIEKLSLY